MSGIDRLRRNDEASNDIARRTDGTRGAPVIFGGKTVKTTATAFAVMLALALAGARADATCYTTTAPDATIPDATGAVGGDIYVSFDLGLLGYVSCLGSDHGFCSFWVYQESNGIPSLQRDDEAQSDVAGCTDGTRGDTLIF